MVKRGNRGELPDTEATTLVINKKRFQDEKSTFASEAFISAKKNLKKHLQAFKELAK